MRVPAYRKHSSGQARVTINGRDHLLGPSGSPESKEKYGRLVAEYSATGKSKSFGSTDEFLIEDLLLAFLLAFVKHPRNNYNESNEFRNFPLAAGPVQDLYGTLPSRQFGPAEFRAVREKWLEDPKRSRQYINKQMKRLLAILKWGASYNRVTAENFIACQCVASLKKGRVAGLRESEKIKPVEDSLVERTLVHMTKVVGDMIRFQRLTGCSCITQIGKFLALHAARRRRHTVVQTARRFQVAT